MPRLWSPTYATPANYNIPRQYWYEVALAWWPSIVLQSGNPLVIRETLFGGYRIYLKFRDDVWAWSSNTYTLDWSIEDIYGMAPADDTPIYSSAFVVSWGIGQSHKHGLLDLFGGQPGYQYQYFTLPSQPAGYWLPKPYA